MKHEIKNNILTLVLSRAQIQIYKLNFPPGESEYNKSRVISPGRRGVRVRSGELAVIGLMYCHLQTVLCLRDLQLLSHLKCNFRI